MTPEAVVWGILTVMFPAEGPAVPELLLLLPVPEPLSEFPDEPVLSCSPGGGAAVLMILPCVTLAAICCNDALVIVRSLMVRAELPGPIILKLTEKSSPPVLVPVEEAHTTRTAFFPAFW